MMGAPTWRNLGIVEAAGVCDLLRCPSPRPEDHGNFLDLANQMKHLGPAEFVSALIQSTTHNIDTF